MAGSSKAGFGYVRVTIDLLRRIGMCLFFQKHLPLRSYDESFPARSDTLSR